MRRTIWTPLAERELDDILLYIGVECRRPETAERLYFEIRDAVNEHARHDLPGSRHPALPDGWLYLMHKRWLIAYESSGDSIIVQRIIDAARDLPVQFTDK